jgi:hypothetical protein
MTLYLFGLGSLMHPSSIGRALGRSVLVENMVPTKVFGMRRDWGLRETVLAHQLNRRVNAAFLDVQPAAEK